MDFRRLEYRREVFLRLYTFHLKFRAHPGCVYFLIPYLRQHLNWTQEDALWWAFLNGNTQHPVTSTLLWQRFPSVHTADPDEIHAYLSDNWPKLEFDSDRRYWKIKLADAVRNYQVQLKGASQQDYFDALAEQKFLTVWKTIRAAFYGFGRLSAWSYLEYLRILGLPIIPDTLFLADRDGSKSHRNGLCKVLGRDDLDWHDSNPDFPGRYSPAQMVWLTEEGARLLDDMRARTPADAPWAQDVGYLTLESTLCNFKSWFRPNRRYPGCYVDMLHDRITRAERVWDRPFDLFWDARRAALPTYLRLEDMPLDQGLVPEKQNHYRLTGQVIMMHHEWPCFANDYNARVEQNYNARVEQAW